MDPKAIEADIKNYKIRQGPLYKRSKFLKEWRERWIVLTSNYMYTFANKNLEDVTDIIDLKQIKSYKSYLRKDQEMIPPGFKIRSADDQFYFCAKNCNEKWSWLVSLERLMDYKYVGTSNYNNVDWIKTKGFQSQTQFQTGSAKNIQQQAQPVLDKQKSSDEAKKQVDDEAEKILKALQEQQKQLDKKREELEKKQAEFILQQKKQEEEKKHQQVKKEQVKPQPKPEPEKPKPVEVKPKQVKKTQDSGESTVAKLRNLYESKMNQPKQTVPKYDTSKYQQKKVQKKADDMHLYRAKIVNSLFQQFRKQAAFTNGLKYVTDFLVNVCADEKLGYSPFVVIQGKTNHNKKQFSEVFIELLSVFNQYDRCENLMRFIETCVFQMPGLFDAQQTASIQRKLKQFFNHVNDQEKLALIIKNMFIMNKLNKYQKNDLYAKLDKLVKDAKLQETRNWAKKLRDDI